MGYKDADVRREKQREYMRLWRSTLREFHLCERCQGQDAFTLAGRKLCADCNEAEKEYQRLNYAKIAESRNEKIRSRREERREKHQCTTCGKPLQKTYTYSTCEHCRALSRAKKERAQIWDGRLDREAMRDLGLCVRCGAPRMDGETAFSGRLIMLCERCYEQSCENLKKGRDAYLAKHGMTWGQKQYEIDTARRSGD